jgi:hypothetical protein
MPNPNDHNSLIELASVLSTQANMYLRLLLLSAENSADLRLQDVLSVCIECETLSEGVAQAPGV